MAVDRLLVDVNIFMDVAFDREPHAEASMKVLSLIENKQARGIVSAVSYPIFYYFLRKSIGIRQARGYLEDLIQLFDVAPVGEETLLEALESPLEDFEDGIQLACAQKAKADYIVTRNIRHFRKSPIRALAPAEYLALKQN